MKLYGIKNCDTVKKSKKLLDAKGVAYDFVDYRAEKVSEEELSSWLEKLGADVLMNKRSTTWKNLSEEEKEQGALSLLGEHPTLIKRPVMVDGETVAVGYKDLEAYVS